MKSKRSLYFLLAALCFVAALVWLSIPSHAKTSGNYQYEFQEDGTVEITKYTGKETDVKIPATIEGKKVTKIGGNVYGDEKIYTGAFHSLINVNSIVIPDGVKIIGKCAFYSCYAKSITIPNSVVKIEEQAFSMTGLKNVIIPNSVTDIGEEAFAGCYSLESIHIPASVNRFKSILQE